MLSIAPGLAVSPLSAQQRISAPRADGQSTPLLVYKAENPTAACAPLAVLSHGAGGSEQGLSYLARALAGDGYTAVVMGHRESGRAVVDADVLAHHGRQSGLQALVKDRNAEQARLLDVGAALKWADAQCKAPFRVLLGHSMGAETVMLEAGARNNIGIASPPAEQNRFDAYVAMSPQGPGGVFADGAWSSIHKPLFVMTGSLDGALQPGGAQSREVPWRELPGDGARRCQWLGVIDGATHSNFAGRGPQADAVDSHVTSTVTTFLKDVRAEHCSAPAPQTSLTLAMK